MPTSDFEVAWLSYYKSETSCVLLKVWTVLVEASMCLSPMSDGPVGGWTATDNKTKQLCLS